MTVAFYGPPVGTLLVYGLVVHWLYEKPRPRLLRVARWTLGLCLAAAAVLIVLFDLAMFGVHVPGQANTKSVYLLPDHFVGPVIVLFDQPNGVAPARKNNTQVYIVPSSGIVRMRSELDRSGVMPSYFYVDQAGRRRPIPLGAPWNLNLPDSQLQVEDMLQMDTTGNDTHFDAQYRVSIVGRKIDFPLLQERANRLLDSLKKNE
jgi:hypothetical protein